METYFLLLLSLSHKYESTVIFLNGLKLDMDANRKWKKKTKKNKQQYPFYEWPLCHCPSKNNQNRGIQRKDSKTLSVIVGRMLLELALVVIFAFFPPTGFTVITRSLAIINLSWWIVSKETKNSLFYRTRMGVKTALNSIFPKPSLVLSGKQIIEHSEFFFFF